MSERASQTEARVAPVIAGDLEPTDDAVAAVLEADPGLAKTVRELRQTARSLDAAARWRDDVLEELDSIADAPGADRVAAVLFAEAGLGSDSARQDSARQDSTRQDSVRRADESFRPPSRTIPREALAAAAALLVLAAGWLVLHPWDRIPTPADPPSGELRLDASSPIRALTPGAETSLDALEFGWESSVSLPPAGYFEVRVYEGESPLEARRVGRSPKLDATAWKPTEDERARWKGVMCWEVQAFDATGQRIATSNVVVFSLSE